MVWLAVRTTLSSTRCVCVCVCVGVGVGVHVCVHVCIYNYECWTREVKSLHHNNIKAYQFGIQQLYKYVYYMYVGNQVSSAKRKKVQI